MVGSVRSALTSANTVTIYDGENIRDMSARRQDLVNNNLGLIGWAIKRFFPHVHETDREDAWQDGFFGLVRAARGYDFDMGLKFSTYATTWIRSSIQKGRGQANGVNFRRAVSNGDVFVAPLSLDKGFTTASSGTDWSDSPLNDRIADTSDTGKDATNMAVASSLVSALMEASRDEMDKAIAEEIIGSTYEDRSFDFKKLTTQFNFSRYGIHLRRKRLIERVKTIYELEEDDV